MVQSILRCFSPGFAVLTHKDKRLAYLQVLDREAPREQYQRRFSFYEFWNEDYWQQLLTKDGDRWSVLAALQREMDQGELQWALVIRSPTGFMRKKMFDTKGVTITEGESDEVVTINGHNISKVIELSKPLHECPSEIVERQQTTFAKSEEFTLHCDIPSCEAALTTVAGVPRKEHGWGRVSVYNDPGAAGVVGHGAVDYDLCNKHQKQITALLKGGDD